MKRELLITGLALVVSILLSAPSIAQPSNAANAMPAPMKAGAVEDEPIPSLDELVQGDFAPEDRARMLLRCIGPAPRPFPSAQAQSLPASEPDVLVNASSSLPS